MVRVQLGRGGGDGSRALEQAYNAGRQEWFRKEAVKHSKGRTACRTGPSHPNVRRGFLSLPELSALIVVLAEESLRRGQRAFAVARSAIDRPHDELADI